MNTDLEVVVIDVNPNRMRQKDRISNPSSWPRLTLEHVRMLSLLHRHQEFQARSSSISASTPSES